MNENDDMKGNIPAYLAGTIGSEEKQKIDDALSSSEDLKKELRFWRKIQRLVLFEDSLQREAHLSPEQIIDFLESRLPRRERELIEQHVASCPTCSEETDTIAGTYPAREVVRSHEGPSLLQTLLEYLTPPRLAYVVGAVGLILIALVIIHQIRKPNWESIRESADAMLRQGDLKGAEESYQQSLALLKLEDRRYPFEAAPVFDSLAVINSRVGYPAGSRYFLEQSLQVRQENMGRDEQSLAWVFERLGMIEKAGGEFAAAEILLRRAEEIRELLAESHPDDPNLSVYKRKPRYLALVPQGAFRDQENQTLPGFVLEDQTTHVSMLITLRQPRPENTRFLPTLTTPSQVTLPIPDTLALDPADPSGKIVRLTLSRRYFEQAAGRYRLLLSELETSGMEEVIHSYSFRITD